jgi:uncharacterized protein YceK
MNQIKWMIVLTIGLIPLLAMGCASIITGTSQQVNFNSNPAGAKVVIAPGGTTGTTPFTAKLAKGRSYTCTATKDGYDPDTQHIGKVFNGWFIGNALIGGIIGVIIDIADGAWFNLSIESVNFQLPPKQK